MKGKKVVLGSASVRREQILRMMGVKFVKIPPCVDENIGKNISPLLLCKKLAKLKAEAVAMQCDSSCLVIGADTLVYLDGKILGKPADMEEARRYLQKLSGRTHSVYTGVCVHYKRKSRVSFTKAMVSFAELSCVQIDQYLMTKEPYDKAGAYALQGIAGQFVSKINGDWLTVVGLPASVLAELVGKSL